VFEATVFDSDRQQWRRFSGPERVLTARQEAQVPTVLDAVQQAAEAGRYAVGFVSYEAAHAFDPALTHHPAGDLPLAQFGIYRTFQHVQAGAEEAWLTLKPDTDRAEFESAIELIKGYLEQGDSYQVNYTHRLEGAATASAREVFWSLVRAQRSAYAALIETDDFAICSISPELFFEKKAGRISMQPMKGTRPRGRYPGEDARNLASLRDSEKDRAEILMIVDMIRNDLGRIARPGSVRVEELFRVRKLPTVWQQVSDVAAEARAGLPEIFAALFPCASVTGAPKARTMEIIREIEKGPRGVYTGAIGLVAPGGDARFSVAIRTLTIDRRTARASYGVGGGIVWDSDPLMEWQECQHKARVLTFRRPDFRLFETMRYDPARGITLESLHRNRMKASADYFDFAFSDERWRDCLAGLAGDEPLRVRLLMWEDGRMELHKEPLARAEDEVRLRLAASPVSSEDIFLFHKTTYREPYESARKAVEDCDDVLLYNERGEITETTIANVFLEIDGELLTPSRHCGLLAGTYRQQLLNEGRAREAVLTLEQLSRVDRLYVANAVRGLRPARMLEPDQGRGNSG
jgi:para-aminobenzoate synthetase/4-amino-4-deoxychorismate lyase